MVGPGGLGLRIRYAIKKLKGKRAVVMRISPSRIEQKGQLLTQRLLKPKLTCVEVFLQ